MLESAKKTRWFLGTELVSDSIYQIHLSKALGPLYIVEILLYTPDPKTKNKKHSHQELPCNGGFSGGMESCSFSFYAKFQTKQLNWAVSDSLNQQ